MDKAIERLQRCQIRRTTPCEFLKEDVLPKLGITQVAFAEKLGVSHRTISEVLNEKRPVSVDLVGALWINIQRQVDTWDALHIDASKYEVLEPLRKTA